MKIAYILFDGITTLDFIGIYDPISRLQSLGFLPDLTWDICAMSDSIKDSFGLEIKADKVQETLEKYDMIIVPGGYGTEGLQEDEVFKSWLKTAENVPYKVSICTGSLLLGAVGFLQNKKATTHFDNYKNLEKYCNSVVQERIVEDGQLITAGAVASSLDLGLFLCEKLAGSIAKNKIQQSMDYHPA